MEWSSFSPFSNWFFITQERPYKSSASTILEYAYESPTRSSLTLLTSSFHFPHANKQKKKPEESDFSFLSHAKMAERGGFEPPVSLAEYGDLANRCLQPLGHLSKIKRVRWSAHTISK